MKGIVLSKTMGEIINEFCDMLVKEGMDGDKINKQQSMTLKLKMLGSDSTAIQAAFWAGCWYTENNKKQQNTSLCSKGEKATEDKL
jgi:hypothetical protein